MRPLFELRALVVWLGLAAIVLTMACSGGGTSFASNEVPTNVAGQSNTSGISAGAAFQAPGGSQTTATATSTSTPAPTK